MRKNKETKYLKLSFHNSTVQNVRVSYDWTSIICMLDFGMNQQGILDSVGGRGTPEILARACLVDSDGQQCF